MDERPEPFRVGIVPGVTITRWTRAWEERRPGHPLKVVPLAEEEQRAALDDGLADVCFVRLPVDREGLDVIRLYAEAPVVVVSREHLLSLADEVTLSDLEGEVVRHEPPADAVEIVAAGAGVMRVPHSIARLHSRKDVVAVPLTDAAETEIALAWPHAATSDDIEYFVGIVRGRTATSSRGAEGTSSPKEQKRKQKSGAAKKTATGRARASGAGRRRR
ncbi:LysR substrate-binding domain-containing protein [Salinibacterium sp. SYSU T00001]|uniref:LysR substrate-binding domain-containing protein n=1 Tax=Homoserinimonas sedimenticola TaxID=2986805 RepID=UPI002235D9E6|nr:LysR substrate-binding domain-containing protein [Salinibacterium sedimenticola]MCW4384447.1 LysR substrate-binding domain-containing protein [Salinibacterium sedimenticola]